MTFEKNVFINCPFDDEYMQSLRVLLFLIIKLNFEPRISLERSDSSEYRLDKIISLIEKSKFSIHDLSRIKAKKMNEYYRLNMPFELGIDLGRKKFSTREHKEKKFLVLGGKKYDYMKALSDFSGFDIKYHESNPKVLLTEVRNWFIGNAELKGIPGPSKLWGEYCEFNARFYDERKSDGFSESEISKISVPEFISYVKEWCSNRT